MKLLNNKRDRKRGTTKKKKKLINQFSMGKFKKEIKKKLIKLIKN